MHIAGKWKNVPGLSNSKACVPSNNNMAVAEPWSFSSPLLYQCPVVTQMGRKSKEEGMYVHVADSPYSTAETNTTS